MLYNTAAGISVLSAAAVDGKGGGRALGHWSGWLRQAVDQLSASDLLLMNPTDAYSRCQLRWGLVVVKALQQVGQRESNFTRQSL